MSIQLGGGVYSTAALPCESLAFRWGLARSSDDRFEIGVRGGVEFASVLEFADCLIHIGSTFGGSPAVAFRRRENGNLRITTRGEFNTSNTTRYDKPLSFGQVHDLVYRVVLDPKVGELTVWLDGVKIVDIRGQSIGASTAECHLQLGAYYAGGITCPVVAEYANHVYPSPTDLSARIGNLPVWPND